MPRPITSPMSTMRMACRCSRIIAATSTSEQLTVTASNTGSTPATLACWIDFNRDGDFLDTGERASTTVPANAGTADYNLTFSGVCGADSRHELPALPYRLQCGRGSESHRRGHVRRGRRLPAYDPDNRCLPDGWRVAGRRRSICCLRRSTIRATVAVDKSHASRASLSQVRQRWPVASRCRRGRRVNR